MGDANADPEHSGDAWPCRSTWALRQGRWTQLEDHIEWRSLVQPHGLIRPPATKLVVRFETTGDEDGTEDLPAQGPGDETDDDASEGVLDQALEQLFEMEPEAAEEAAAGPAASSSGRVREEVGDDDDSRAKRRRQLADDVPQQIRRSAAGRRAAGVMMNLRARGVGSKVLDKKQIDKEIPYHQIAPEDREKFQEAEKKRWEEWKQYGSARPLSTEETAKVVGRERILGSRFVYRDKNSSIRTPQRPLPVAPKARLCSWGRIAPTAPAAP